MVGGFAPSCDRVHRRSNARTLPGRRFLGIRDNRPKWRRSGPVAALAVLLQSRMRDLRVDGAMLVTYFFGAVIQTIDHWPGMPGFRGATTWKISRGHKQRCQ